MRLSNKKICVIADVAMCVVIAVFLGLIFTRQPRWHFDIDRAEYPVKGIDISAHNGNIDFIAAKADTVAFAFIKATEGTDFCDANFNRNYLGARDAGIKVGAYHFFRFTTPGKMQAQHFLGTIAGRTFDLPLAVDVERSGNSTVYDADHVKQQLREFIETVREAGYPLVIYTNKHDYGVFIQDHFSEHRVWLCSLSARQARIESEYWQHSHRGQVKGVPTPVDLNTYCGSRREFDKNAIPFTVEAQ